MFGSTHRSFLRSAVLTALLLTAMTGAAKAACYSAAQALPQADIDAFLSNAAQILQQSPDGGPLMITRVRDLAASNPATLQVLIGLISSASSNQRTAIGTGLGQAAQICVKPDQIYATEIQRLVSLNGNVDVVTALAAVLGDAPIGALGGGAGGISAGAGGPTNSSTPPQFGFGTLQTFGTAATKNSFVGFTAPLGATAGSSPPTTTTIIIRSVSPH